MTSPDNQSSMLSDAQAAVRIATEALASDNVDMAVAVFAGFLVVAQRIGCAITEAMAQYAKASADRLEAHSRAMVAGLHESVAMEREMARPEPIVAAGCPVHDGSIHGGEAEELRAGIKRLITDDDLTSGALRLELQDLLDRVDARDSLAYLERTDEERAALTFLLGALRRDDEQGTVVAEMRPLLALLPRMIAGGEQ